MNLKDTDILRQTFPDGTKVSLSCDVGYTSAGGSSVITCTAGSWSPVRLTCERKNCMLAGDVPNGQIDYSQGTQFGDKAVITCNTGYTLVGSRELFCGSFGWLNRLPVCEVVKCLQPPVVVNGVFSPNKEQYEYGDAVKYSCDQNYTLVGSFFSFLFCSEDGTFKPDPPTCVRDCRVDGTAFQSPGGLPSTSSDAASARAGQQDDGLTFYERLVVEFHKEMLRKSMK
ncbi:hypothetical protein Q5P01_008103 [Channa striata]|uniref:Sushi domain-containing protein n=1 Tax=Channa striata TaxID=64152 RepID=A0AA88N7Y6_CHASR|nr:hypothetical protein Q5P01_008103 [Channa striata]